MAFNRNPHVPKARAAEQKAAEAADDAARVRALREAAHLWDRAAERESPGKLKTEYERQAAENRRLADADASGGVDADGPLQLTYAGAVEASTIVLDPKLLN